jgi:hypothetical protein
LQPITLAFVRLFAFYFVPIFALFGQNFIRGSTRKTLQIANDFFSFLFLTDDSISIKF